MVTSTRAPVTAQASARSAYRWLLAAVILAVLAFGVGTAWDRAWHTRNPFEDFWSPPHVFIYTTHLLATLALAKIAFTADLRRHFGRPLKLGVVGDMPAALVFAGGGFALIALAGALDAVWHARFGLDETAWSLPHSMLGAGILVSVLGFVAARFALIEERPLAPWAPGAFATLLIGTFAAILLGPLDNYRSPEHLRAVASLPPLAASAEFQHTVRIHERWELMRTGPLFAPLAALVAGIGLAFARALLRRTWAFVLVALAATVLAGDGTAAAQLGLSPTRENTAPIPYVVPALAYVIVARVASDVWAWRAAGLSFAVAVYAIWGATLVGVLAAAPLMAVGASIGRTTADLVRAPDQRVLRLTAVLGVGLPALTGAVDLFLRSRTP